jgi:hypothetical protein
VINGLVIVLERFFDPLDPLDFENILKILPILEIDFDRDLDLVLDAGLDILCLDLEPGFEIIRFDIPLVRTLDRTLDRVLDRVLVRFGPLIINL